MRLKLSKYLIVIFFSSMLLALNAQSIRADLVDYELVTFTTEDGGVIEASYFEGGQGHVVIFAHGAIFSKESWYFMAEKLQKQGISSLSLDFRGYGNSKKGTTDKRSLDILGAIDYLNGKKGFKKISIVGGSMGGAAVLNALNIKTSTEIDKVVLLAPAGGTGIVSKYVKKLFVVSKNERLFPRVNTIYNESSEPKELKVFPGTTHAQHMFKTEYSNELTEMILKFLNPQK